MRYGDTSGGGGGNRTRTRDIVTNHNTNILQDIKNGEVAKNGHNNVQGDGGDKLCDSNELEGNKQPKQSSLAAAIIAVNKLPLPNSEKTEMIRLIMSEVK